MTLAAALVAIAAFAAFDEWHQGFVARDPAVLDWLADVVGAFLGIMTAARARTAEPAQ
jgi:VanZ family protein